MLLFKQTAFMFVECIDSCILELIELKWNTKTVFKPIDLWSWPEMKAY